MLGPLRTTLYGARGTARAGVWGREMNYTATIQDPPTPQPELLRRRARPCRMPTLSGPQEQVLRHTVDQIVVAVSALPTFDVPVPQTVDQLVGALLHLDTPIPEHAPQISCPSRFPRSVLREPQKAEQLVSCVSVEVFEQPVDIPVRAWGGAGGRLQGFLPGQSSTAVAEQIVDIPVPHGGRLLQDLGLASFPQEVAGEAFQVVFSTFPRRKKVRSWGPHSGSQLSADITLSTSPAQQQSTSPAMERETWVKGDDVWVRVDTLQGPYWRLLLSDHWQWYPPWLGH